jgi:AraC-like DNA-binding protein
MVLGRSILQEIRRMRVGLIARILMETDLLVPQIAGALRYENLQLNARYFRKEKHMTLMVFRKCHGSRRATTSSRSRFFRLRRLNLQLY